MMRCDRCNGWLVKVDRRMELAELDGEASEGQMADYLAAEESGDYGAWGVGVIEYECSKCKLVYEIISDDLNSYDTLIMRWHDKAKSGDFFSRFVFEYLAFTALLKNRLFIHVRSDRDAIQHLKRDADRKECYLNAIEAHVPLRSLWQEVIAELERSPLRNNSRDLDNPEVDVWWNSSGRIPGDDDKDPRGIVRSLSDWENMVEFWHSVRNNLFHGGKDPGIRRDCFLVEHAYLTLAHLVEKELKRTAT